MGRILLQQKGNGEGGRRHGRSRGTRMGMFTVGLFLIGPWTGCTDADPLGPGLRGGGNTGPQEAPAVSSNLYQNEPGGFTRITERHFEAREDDGWRTGDHAEFSIANDPSAPVSNPFVGEVRFPKGFTGGSSPTWSQRSISEEGTTSVYVSFWLKVSENFQGHPVNSKIAYVWTHGKPVVFPVYIGRDDEPLSTEVRIQDTPSRSHNFPPNLGDVTIERGEWHQWEMVLVNNTGNDGNGEIHWWIDGEKIGAYDDVQFSSASQDKIWERVTWRPVWGGNGGQVREDMYMRMDRFYVSGAR